VVKLEERNRKDNESLAENSTRGLPSPAIYTEEINNSEPGL